MSFRTPLFNQSVKNNILRDLEGEILRGLFFCIQKTTYKASGSKELQR